MVSLFFVHVAPGVDDPCGSIVSEGNSLHLLLGGSLFVVVVVTIIVPSCLRLVMMGSLKNQCAKPTTVYLCVQIPVHLIGERGTKESTYAA